MSLFTCAVHAVAACVKPAFSFAGVKASMVFLTSADRSTVVPGGNSNEKVAVSNLMVSYGLFASKSGSQKRKPRRRAMPAQGRSQGFTQVLVNSALAEHWLLSSTVTEFGVPLGIGCVA